MDDGQMFLSVALRSHLETADEILELTKEVSPAGGHQYQLMLTFFKVDVNGHIIITYSQTFSLMRVKQLKICAQGQK